MVAKADPNLATRLFDFHKHVRSNYIRVRAIAEDATLLELLALA